MQIDIAQVQKLLNAMGHNVGKADNIWGELSQAGLDSACRKYGVLSSDADFWQEIRHFKREEFRCRCPRCGGFPAEPKEKMVRLAEQVRTHFDAPATVSSGVRCPAHNAEVGGVSNSRHLYGQAVDLSVKGHSAREVTAYAASLPGCAYTYAIDENFVHMDVAA